MAVSVSRRVQTSLPACMIFIISTNLVDCKPNRQRFHDETSITILRGFLMGVGLALLLVVGIGIFVWILIKFIKQFMLPDQGSYVSSLNRQTSKNTDVTVVSGTLASSFSRELRPKSVSEQNDYRFEKCKRQ